MISTRPNTNTDFWWTTTNPAVVSDRNNLAALFEENDVLSEQTISSDGLTCTKTYTVENQSQWATLVAESRIRIPNIGQNRRGYHSANNHTFKLEVRAETGELLQEVQIIPAP